ncbi:MAG: lysophospholipid acyltransferase family protein [Candidatus Omnitrophica bacterium]|nr:lysophospholipid acyltransferase family protein [Candidatus Omnitrophota bacterium]
MVSIIVWTISIMLTITLYFVILAAVILFPFDRDRRRAHERCYLWSDLIMGLNPFWKIKVSGLENIDHNKTYVIVANHQSLADIVILYQTKTQFKWVAKDSLFTVPFIGWSLSLCKHIRIARGELGSIKKVYKEAQEWLRRGMSVLFFPEGTRSATGEMKDFQNGAFKLAIREKLPVLPILLENTGSAMPKGSWLFEPQAPSRMKVLPAIDTSNFQDADFARLRDITRSMLKSA